MDSQEIQTLVREKTRNELVALCKEKKLPCSGTKQELATRLVGSSQVKKEVSKNKMEPLIIRQHEKDGYFLFQNIVFHPKTKLAYAILLPNGSLSPLQRKEIEICKRYKLKYVLPEVLDDRPDPPEKPKDDSSDEEDEEADDFEEEASDLS